MANDHFISRFLTAPWECADRKLHFFDFRSQSFGSKYSKNLFAIRGLTTPAVEKMLNRYVETPVSRFANQLRRGESVIKAADLDWTIVRALALLFTLNIQRQTEATGDGKQSVRLADIEAGGEKWMEAIAQFTLSNFKIAVVSIGPAFDLCFPEVALFPVPVVGHAAMGIPLSLNAFLLMSRGSSSPPEESLEELSRSDAFPALSIGIGGDSHRVILPPRWRELVRDDEGTARDSLNLLRSSCLEISKQISKLDQLLGMST